MKILAGKPEFDQFLAENPLALVDFSATWCGPCRILTPILEALGRSDPDLAIAKIDLDANQELASEFDIQSIPSLLLFKDGKLIDRKMGTQPSAAIKAWMKSHV